MREDNIDNMREDSALICIEKKTVLQIQLSECLLTHLFNLAPRRRTKIPRLLLIYRVPCVKM